MDRNDTIEQNVLEVNGFVTKLFAGLLIVAPAVILLKYFGSLNLPWIYIIALTSIYVLACIAQVIYKTVGTNANRIKNCTVICSFITVLILYCMFGRVMFALWFFPLILAFLYIDIKTLKLASILIVPGIAVGEAINILYRVNSSTNIFFIYALIAFQIVLFFLTASKAIKSTNKMLNNIQSLHNNISSLIANASLTSDSLKIIEDKFAGELTTSNLDKGEILSSLDGSLADNGRILDEVVKNIDSTVDNTRELLKYNHAIAQVSSDSDHLMEETGKEIKEIEGYTEKSKAAIAELIENAEKVRKAIAQMSEIIDASILISMNASLEAARLGEGNSKAAAELKIKQLADSSADSAFSIKETLKDIAADAECTIKSVNKTYNTVVYSLDMINRTVETLIKWLMLKEMH